MDSKKDNGLLGELRADDLAGFEWYQTGYRAFDPAKDGSPAALEGVRRAEFEVQAYIGTWCGDTHEQLPRLMRILADAGVSPGRVRLVGLGREKAVGIEKLPTFVFTRKGLEIGRIVETPHGTLLDDIASIVAAEDGLQRTYARESTCFGCGPANSKGLRINSRVAPSGDEVVADWQPLAHHEAFPGMLNGGIIGSLLDCHSNWTAAWHLMKKSGAASPPCTVTADYAIKLLRPTPTNAPVHLSAKVVESKDDRATIEATLTAGGKTCATCRGTFVAVKPGHPAYHRW